MHESARTTGTSAAVATLGALGVVFGDIGTSPLYTMTTLLGSHATPLGRTAVLGLTSAILWSLVLVVSVLYVSLLLRTDNEGEGGLLALLVLARRAVRGRVAPVVLTALAMVGAATFLGDSLITPAISVLSAAEGLSVADPSTTSVVVPVSVAVLATLFAVQRFGTARIGHVFGPVMVLWFALISVAGAVAVVREPSVLQALSPWTAVQYARAEPLAAFLSLGGVVLAVTGVEALYADLGHFGRAAVTRGWWCVVLPALVLSYLGQASVALGRPTPGSSTFFALFPSWSTIPVVVVATTATVIASQAVVSGAFTVVHQASRLGLLPPLRIVHTSVAESRQIYLPTVNAFLALGVLALVLGFGSSARLASAYGVAVTTTIVATTAMLLTLTLARSRYARAALVAGLLVVVATFAVATAPKVLDGGWIPVVVAAAVVATMAAWSDGHRRVKRAMAGLEVPLEELRRRLRAHPPVVLDGATVYLTHDLAAPLALTTTLERDHALHRRVVVLGWRTTDTPRVAGGERLHVEDAEEVAGVRLVLVRARIGYAQRVRPQALLTEAVRLRPEAFAGLDPGEATFAVSAPEVVVGPGRLRWREHWFLAQHRATASGPDRLDLPADRTVVSGRRIEI